MQEASPGAHLSLKPEKYRKVVVAVVGNLATALALGLAVLVARRVPVWAMWTLLLSPSVALDHRHVPTIVNWLEEAEDGPYLVQKFNTGP